MFNDLIAVLKRGRKNQIVFVFWERRRKKTRKMALFCVLIPASHWYLECKIIQNTQKLIASEKRSRLNTFRDGTIDLVRIRKEVCNQHGSLFPFSDLRLYVIWTWKAQREHALQKSLVYTWIRFAFSAFAECLLLELKK